MVLEKPVCNRSRVLKSTVTTTGNPAHPLTAEAISGKRRRGAGGHTNRRITGSEAELSELSEHWPGWPRERLEEAPEQLVQSELVFRGERVEPVCSDRAWYPDPRRRSLKSRRVHLHAAVRTRWAKFAEVVPNSAGVLVKPPAEAPEGAAPD